MSEKKEQKADPQACSYITFNTVDWVDIFVRPVYKQIIVDELNCYIVSERIDRLCLVPDEQSSSPAGKEQ